MGLSDRRFSIRVETQIVPQHQIRFQRNCKRTLQMQTIDTDISWYALHVRPRFEKIVSRNLQAKGYEEFLPVYRRRSRWSDRTKEIELPLFPGYVFCRFDVHQRLPILMIPGVNSVVGFGKSPLPIEQHELDDIRSVLKSGADCEPWPYLREGQMVEV